MSIQYICIERKSKVCIKEGQCIICIINLVQKFKSEGVCIKERQYISCLVQMSRSLYQGKALHHMPSPTVQGFVSRKGTASHVLSKCPGVCVNERQCITCLVQKSRSLCQGKAKISCLVQKSRSLKLCQGKAMNIMPSPKVQEFVSRKGNASHA